MIRGLFERAISLSLPPKKMKVHTIYRCHFLHIIVVFPVETNYMIFFGSSYSRNTLSTKNLLVMRNRLNLSNRKQLIMSRAHWPKINALFFALGSHLSLLQSYKSHYFAVYSFLLRWQGVTHVVLFPSDVKTGQGSLVDVTQFWLRLKSAVGWPTQGMELMAL